MSRAVLVRWAKWLWIIAVLIAVGFFIHKSWPKLHAGLSRVEPIMVLSSLVLTVLAKFVLGENAHLAAWRCGIEMPYGTALRLYNLSQLGKYMPGSVWQFVGRAAAYRERGADFGAIRDSLLVESLWVVASASVLGTLLAGSQALVYLHEKAPTAIIYWLVALMVLGVVVLLVGVLWRRDLLVRYWKIAHPSLRAILILLGTWVLLGLAFWVLCRAAHVRITVPYATGLFSLAFALGFLVPIAPAGLGIRDGILTLGLLPYGSFQEAIVVTVVARLIYLVAELGLVGIQEVVLALLGRFGQSGSGLR